MANDMQNKERELLAAVDYILNRAGEKEIEVITAALERKKNEASAASPLAAINPENMAKQMSESINKSIQASLEGVRHTFRDFAADMLLKEAPELSEDQMKALIDSWIPEQGSYDGKIKSIAKNGKVDGVPADVLYGMVLQFVSYSIGEMSAKENDELKTAMGNWTEKYWSRFPMRVKEEIKSFINGEITSGEFRKNITAFIS